MYDMDTQCAVEIMGWASGERPSPAKERRALPFIPSINFSDARLVLNQMRDNKYRYKRFINNLKRGIEENLGREIPFKEILYHVEAEDICKAGLETVRKGDDGRT